MGVKGERKATIFQTPGRFTELVDAPGSRYPLIMQARLGEFLSDVFEFADLMLKGSAALHDAFLTNIF